MHNLIHIINIKNYPQKHYKNLKIENTSILAKNDI